MNDLKFLAIAALGLAVYFLPSIIAGRREHASRLAILALNLSLGWTFLGWLTSLIWALSGRSGRILARCPACAEAVQPEARKCKHCGADFASPARP